VRGAIALAMGGYTARAQDVTATITGTVMDASGGAVVGATVTAKSVNAAPSLRPSPTKREFTESRSSRSAAMSSRGEERVSDFLVSAFALVLNQIARIDVQMKVAK